MVTTGQPTNPQSHREAAIPAGKLCLSFQVEEKEADAVLQALEEGNQLNKAELVSDRQSVLTKTKQLVSPDSSANHDER